MNKVYAVYIGNGYPNCDEQFSWEIDKIFRNKEDAEKYIATTKFDTAYSSEEQPWIEEYELN